MRGLNDKVFESPQGVLNIGFSYLTAAEYLRVGRESGSVKLPFTDPIWFLLGHSLELILKAGLYANGAEGDAWGHDLIDLRELAIRKGCQLCLSETELGHLRLLNNLFGKETDYAVRYLKTGSAQVHDDAIVFKFAKRFACETAELVRSLPSPLAGEGSGMGGVTSSLCESAG